MSLRVATEALARRARSARLGLRAPKATLETQGRREFKARRGRMGRRARREFKEFRGQRARTDKTGRMVRLARRGRRESRASPVRAAQRSTRFIQSAASIRPRSAPTWRRYSASGRGRRLALAGAWLALTPARPNSTRLRKPAAQRRSR